MFLALLVVLNGFVIHGTGELRGTVTKDGKPVAGVHVHVVGDNAQEAVTAPDGTYTLALAGGDHAFVYIDGDAQLTAQLATPGSDSVIELHEVLPPAVPAKAHEHADVILDYSDDASDADTWARAWLLLDVSETGAVSQVKLLNDPGHALAPIAIKAALAMTFDPARDRANRPIRSTVLWTYEWPAYWWLVENHYARTRLPLETFTLPCNGHDSKFVRHRDCTPPDLSKIVTAPWQSRARSSSR
jgi:hypothetical protein